MDSFLNKHFNISFLLWIYIATLLSEIQSEWNENDPIFLSS